MRRAILIVVVVAFCTSSRAQSRSDTPPRCTIAGTAIDAISGQPVRAAEITATNLTRDNAEVEQPNSTNSDASGRFAIENLLPGRYVVQSYREGYTGPERQSGSGFEIVTLLPGQRIENAVVTLMPGGTITGRVADEAGTYLSGVSLQALKYSYREGKRELEEMASASTNGRGEYRITGLAKGRYYLRATSTYRAALKVGKDRAYVPLYYPDSTDLAHAAELEVHPGEELTGIDVSFGPRPAVDIRGRVFAPRNSSQLKGVEVTLLSDKGSTFFSPGQTSTDNEGSFDFSGIPSGSYILVAQLDSHTQPEFTLWGRTSVEVGDMSVEDVTILLSAGVNVVGRIRVDGEASLDIGNLKAILEPQEGLTLNSLMPLVENASVGPDGTFIFRHVAEGSYNISLFPLPGGFYIAENDGSVDLGDGGIMVGPSHGPARLELVLSAASARIDGTVSGDRPVADASIVLMPDNWRGNQPRYYRTSVSDRMGKFTFQGVAPGDYKLFAWDKAQSGAFMDPEFLREYEDRGQLVHLEERTRASVQLQIIAASPAP